MNQQTTQSPKSLDTLVQLTQADRHPEADLLKKAKRKALTVFLSGKLIELQNSRIQAYRNMYYCNSVLQQNGQELKTSYCKNRFCHVCNAIKTANLIDGYLPELKSMKDPQFLTLTIKAVKAKQLRPAISGMIKTFRSINQHLNKYEHIKLKAIRKLECNYNPVYDTYNPHFHFVIEGEHQALTLRKHWLMRYTNAQPIAQNCIPADQDSMIELFKYATKMIAKDGGLYPQALDNIYAALSYRRIVQPVGIKKIVNEDEREKVVYPELQEENALWKWSTEQHDWYNENTGESLTGYMPDHDTMMLFRELRI